jgi:hypothetical protein
MSKKTSLILGSEKFFMRFRNPLRGFYCLYWCCFFFEILVVSPRTPSPGGGAPSTPALEPNAAGFSGIIRSMCELFRHFFWVSITRSLQKKSTLKKVWYAIRLPVQFSCALLLGPKFVDFGKK